MDALNMDALKDVEKCVPCDGYGWTCECIYPPGRWSGDRAHRKSHVLHCSRRKQCEACDGAGLPKRAERGKAGKSERQQEKAQSVSLDSRPAHR